MDEFDLLLEVMKITRNVSEQPPKQEQLMIGAENRFKADKVTVNKQEVTIGNRNVITATKVPGGYILKVPNTKLKDIKSDLNSDVRKSDLRSDLESDLRSDLKS